MDPGTLNAIQGFAAISLILVSVAVAATGLRWVWLRTGRPAAPSAETIDQLQGALARLEENEHRVAELEERLDFSERLLAQLQQAPERLPGPR
jgi:hypothetical protein